MSALVQSAWVDRWLAQHACCGPVYRWSWFMPVLQEFTDQALQALGQRGTLDPIGAGAAFFNWARMTEQCSAYAHEQPVDHAHYVCGRLLRCLLHARAFQMEAGLSPSADAAPLPMAQEWPEGHVVLSFVLTLLQTWRLELGAGPLDWQDARFAQHWRSFRENVAEDADRAGPFLDFFVGLEPIWEYPTVPAKRPALRAPTPKPAHTLLRA